MQVYTTEKGFHECEDETLLKPTWQEDGFFETLLWDGEKLLDLQAHQERINRSLEQFYGFSLSIEGIAEKVEKLVTANGTKGKARVRLVARVNDKACFESLVVQPYDRSASDITLRSSDYTPAKKSERSGHKDLRYGDYAKAYAEALQQGADEAVLFNDHGELSECATSNVFFVKGSIVHTPDLASGCLPGIVRRLVIEKLRGCGIAVEEGFYSRADLVDSDFVFVTNSLRRVQPVAAIDDVKLANKGIEVLSLLGKV